jgi:hypothetical protein
VCGVWCVMMALTAPVMCLVCVLAAAVGASQSSVYCGEWLASGPCVSLCKEYAIYRLMLGVCVLVEILAGVCACLCTRSRPRGLIILRYFLTIQ